MNADSVLWSTSGDGILSNPGLLVVQYIPGPNDIQTGSVTLFLNAFGDENCGDAQDSLLINIQQSPVAHAGENSTVNVGDIYQLVNAYILHAYECIWTTSGTGYFNDHGIINPIYYPSENDYTNGEVTLTLFASAINPCSVSSADEMTLSFVETCVDATADAGDDICVCFFHENSR